jgi:hypothetical protein
VQRVSHACGIPEDGAEKVKQGLFQTRALWGKGEPILGISNALFLGSPSSASNITSAPS